MPSHNPKSCVPCRLRRKGCVTENGQTQCNECARFDLECVGHGDELPPLETAVAFRAAFHAYNVNRDPADRPHIPGYTPPPAEAQNLSEGEQPGPSTPHDVTPNDIKRIEYLAQFLNHSDPNVAGFAYERIRAALDGEDPVGGLQDDREDASFNAIVDEIWREGLQPELLEFFNRLSNYQF